MKHTVALIKADIGSIGGHTQPSQEMMKLAKRFWAKKVEQGLIIDYLVTFTGDDVNFILSHQKGKASPEIHQAAWDCFKNVLTASASRDGLYGAGQDLLVDAPSNNIKGAGPAVAEIEMELDFEKSDHRKAEAFLVFAADKCGPGAYNFPFYSILCNEKENAGLILNPALLHGFKVTVIDMDHKAKKQDRVIELNLPEDNRNLICLLRDIDRYAIESVHSRYIPDEQMMAVSATRLHNISGKYSGKDDPVALVRTQGIFCAPEEVVRPWRVGHFVTGGARGSQIMPIMPVAINTPVTGQYCQPLVTCLAFSMDKRGCFSKEYADMFGNCAWDYVRTKVQRKADELSEFAPFGVTMASKDELEYLGIKNIIDAMDSRFSLRDE